MNMSAVVKLSVLACFVSVSSLCAQFPTRYAGHPFSDTRYHDGPQKIPGRVMCAYYDFGGEGVAYHDTDAINQGSGKLNPANGDYLNEFRKDEGIDTSYTKYINNVDTSPYNLVQPPQGLLYVGWNEPGEWFNLTIDVKEAGTYTVDILYTSNRGAKISFDLNQKALTDPFALTTTFNAAETIPWRNWHHWNIAKDAITVQLPKGKQLLTVHIVENGNMNLAYFDFKRKS
jgi:hypothetical protein